MALLEYSANLAAIAVDRKRAEESLKTAKAEADRANLAKSKFLASASHDLRQPVQSLHLLLAILEGEIADRPKLVNVVGMMGKALEGLSSLFNSILDLSRIEAGTRTRQQKGRLRIDIVDTGIGIPADKQAAIFEEFHQLNNDALVRQSLQLMLEGLGYEVVAAADSESALDLGIRENWRFDAIIIDYRLPSGLIGTTTAKEIERRSGRQFPVLVVTGDTAAKRISEIHASGYAILYKPVAPSDLRRTLGDLLRERAPA